MPVWPPKSRALRFGAVRTFIARTIIPIAPPRNTGTSHEHDADYEPKQANLAKIETGSYTGDGATSKVVSLSDSTLIVKWVWVNAQFTSVPADENPVIESDTQYTSDVIIDDISGNDASLKGRNDLSGGQTGIFAVNDDAFIALGTGSFTVDDNSGDFHPNKNNQVYNYMVIGI